MDELDKIREFRAHLRTPDTEGTHAARAALNEAIDDERSGAGFSRMRSSTTTPRWSRALAGSAAAVGLGIALVLALLPSPEDGDAPNQGNALSLSSVAAQIQGYTHLDFDHLADLRLTLGDVAADADLVGIGRIVDVRAAWKEVDPNQGGAADELLHMYVVIEPHRLAKGSSLLGESGEVLVDGIAPPVDRQAGDIAERQREAITAVREAAVGAPERVALMLSLWPPGASVVPPPPVREVVADEFAGRAADDPVFQPTQPSSLFALDERAGVAFPLTTDEQLENVPGNLKILKGLGAKIDRFSAGGDSLGAAQG